MGMEALHPPPRPPHPARGPGPAVAGGQGPVPFRPVPLVGLGHRRRRHRSLGLLHAAARFEPTHRLPQPGVHQPEESGHGRPVVEQRRIHDHRRIALGTPQHHREGTRRNPTEQPGDGLQVRTTDRDRPPIGQLQNSRLCATRDQKPLAPNVLPLPEALAAAFVAFGTTPASADPDVRAVVLVTAPAPSNSSDCFDPGTTGPSSSGTCPAVVAPDAVVPDAAGRIS